MLLDAYRNWRHRALLPLTLTEAAKGVYISKWTPKRVTVYVPDDKGGVKKVAVAHKNLGKYAYKTVDPPPGENPIGYVEDPWKYKGPEDIKKLDEPEPPQAGSPAPAKQAKFIPIYDWNDKSVWVWVRKSGGQPILTEIPHKKVKGYSKRLGWVTQKVKLVGKIDPTNYSGPDDIYPVDWDPDDGPPDFVPTAAQAVSMEFVPEYGDESKTKEPEQLLLKPIVDPGVPELNVSAEFEPQSKNDPHGFPRVKHKGSGLYYSVLPDGSLAVWDKTSSKYLPIKKTGGGWELDHDAPILSPKAASAAAKTKPAALPAGFKLPGDDYKIKTIAKGYVVVQTPGGESIKWDAKKSAWFYMDEPWKEWSPPTIGGKSTPEGEGTPEGAPTPPPGFEVSGGLNKDGAWPLKTEKFHDENWFLLPNGKLAKYDEYKGSYETYTYTTKGLVFDKAPSITAAGVKVQKYYPEPLPVPEGYQLAGYDLNGLPQVNQGSGTKLFTLLPNGTIAVWSFSKDAYKSQKGFSLTIAQIFSGDFGPSLSVPKTEVAEQPEEGPYATKFTGKLDFNGYPMVDEVDPDDPDSPYAETDLTLLPDERVARWSKAQGVYRLYKWDTDEGYVQTHAEVSVQEVERLMASLGLVVKGVRYHKVVQVGDEASVEAGGPPGFELITPTPEQAGLVPATHIATGVMYLLLPGDRAAGLVSGELYNLYQVGAGGKLSSLDKQLTIEMVRAMTQGYDPEPPQYTKYVKGVKAFDPHGYPRVVDEEGERLTLLPNGEVAKWAKSTKTYEVWAYDYGFGGYYPRHPEKSYTLKEVEKLKLKKLKTFKSISPTKAPEPAAAPPSMDSQKGVPVPNGDKDTLGNDVYQYGGQMLVKIPVDTGWGWLRTKYVEGEKVGRYVVKSYNPKTDAFEAKYVGGEPVYWYPGDLEIQVGSKTPSQGVAGVPKWVIKPLPAKDVQGYPKVNLLKNGLIQDFFALLPTGDLGKWSASNDAYVVFKIDKDQEPGVIPIYNTTKLFQPGSYVDGFEYPFVVDWELPKEWKPEDNLPGIPQTAGTWAYSRKQPPAQAGLKSNGEIYVVHIEGSGVVHIPVWDPTSGYLDTPYTKKKGLAEPVATGPDPKEVAKDSAAAEKPTDKSTSQLIADLAGKLPDIGALTHQGSGSYLGGAGKKEIFEDPTTGLKFIFKPSVAKGGGGVEAFRAHAQEAFAALAVRVRADHVPLKTVEYKGVLGTLQPMIELDDEQPDLKKAGGLKPEELTTQQMADVGTEHLLSWLMSQHDDHRGNLLKTKDGRIVSVDKEQGWKYFDTDKLDVDFHPNGKYGEEEPFYNKFWRAFSEGKIDFDPSKALMGALGSIENMSTADYVSTIKGYALASFPGDEVKQDRFLKKALKRKLRLRKDFEDFLTDLYQKRAGKSGAFTFDEGWIADEEVKQKKFKKIKFQGTQLAEEQGLAIKPFKFVGEDGQTEVSEEKVTLKVPKSYPESKLFDFLGELGLEPIPFPNGKTYIEGQAYKMVSVDKQKFDQIQLEKEVPITEAFVATPPKPKYWPEVPDARVMEPTLEKDLASADKLSVGREGHAMLSDGGMVEGQAAKAKRFKDPEGEYLLVTFKLRSKYWKKIKASDVTKSGTFTWYVADYDPKTDTFVENRDFPTYTTSEGKTMVGGQVHTISGVRWDLQTTECFLSTSKDDYCFMGQIYLKIRGASGSVLEVSKASLNKAVPGLGDEVFRSPSPEDLLVMKMMRLLWALRPQVADALPESDRTVSKLRALLKKHKIDGKAVGKIEEQEVVKGHHSHVLPGRWKKLPEVAYLFNGIRDLPAAVSICRSGLLGIHERNLTGIQQFGGSYTPDARSGSGDGILCRVVTKAGFHSKLSASNFSGSYQAIVHPEALDRLDTYMYPHDTFGRCRDDYPGWKNRLSVESHVKKQASNWNKDNEISFRKGLHLRLILRICTSSETLRKGLINAARADGIETVNGVPIEDFVVVAQGHSDVYNRYVKPLLPTPSV